MWDIFGFKRRKEAKLKAEAEKKAKVAAELQAKKEAYQARKKMIETWLDIYQSKQRSISYSVYESNKKNANIANTVCPKCGSTDVVNKVKRVKGELDGSSSHYSHSSYTSGFLYSHSNHSSGGHSKVHGEMDTYPVNRCNKCGHEWNIAEAHWPDTTNDFNKYSSNNPSYLVSKIDGYYDLSYDPKDITEECNSLEEKREKYLKETVSSYCGLTVYKDIPRYMVEVALYEGLDDRYGHYDGFHDVPRYYGKLNKVADKFDYQMPDELWEIVKAILHWEETK